MEEPARTSRSGQVRCLAPSIDRQCVSRPGPPSTLAESSRSSSRRSMTRRSRTLRPGSPTRCTSNACSQPSTRPAGGRRPALLPRSLVARDSRSAGHPGRDRQVPPEPGPRSDADHGRRRRAVRRLGCHGAIRMSHSDTTPRTLTADRLNAAFNEVGGQARPDYLPDIVAQAGRTRQRPAWTFLERWLPMDIAVRRQGVPRAVLVFAVLALLLTLLMATVAFIGTRPSQPPLTGRNQRPHCLRQRRRHRCRRARRKRAAHADQRSVRARGDGVLPGRSASGVLVQGPVRNVGTDCRRCRWWQPRDRRFGESRANGAGFGSLLVAGRLNDCLLCPRPAG